MADWNNDFDKKHYNDIIVKMQKKQKLSELEHDFYTQMYLLEKYNAYGEL